MEIWSVSSPQGIHHGDAILSGRFTPLAYLKMAVTVVVPYCVSVLSSVGASLDLRRPRPGNPLAQSLPGRG